MKPKRLRAWIHKNGDFGVLLVAGYLGLHHLWTKRRPALIGALIACLLMGVVLWPSHHRPGNHRHALFMAPAGPARTPELLTNQTVDVPEEHRPQRTSVPLIARLLGVRVGWNGQRALERRFGPGYRSIGGHPDGRESWNTRRPEGCIDTDGFNYNHEGEVLETVSWSLGPCTGQDIPTARRLPHRAGWLGIIYPGMTEQQVTRLIADRLPAPYRKDGRWTWIAKGYVRPNPINEDVYRTWTASLSFSDNRLMSIDVDCE